MPAKNYRIKLSEAERAELEEIRDRGSRKASIFKKALALLLSDEGPGRPAKTDEEIHAATGMSSSSLFRLRRRCCECGPLDALVAKVREKPAVEKRITGDVEAHIIQLACSGPPAGFSRWTLRRMARHLVEIEVIDRISHTSVGKVLKKARSSRGGRNRGASRPRGTPPS